MDIRSNKDLIDNAQYFGWDYVSMFNPLPESFIRKHADEVHWAHINDSQVFSEDFFMEFSNHMKIENINVALNPWADPKNWSPNLKAFLKIKGEI
jgi:hypothetical protein